MRFLLTALIVALIWSQANATNPAYVVLADHEVYQVTMVAIRALPDTAVFGQVTLEWDSADTQIALSSVGLLVGGLSFITTEPCCAQQEYGDSRLLIQWAKIPGAPGIVPEWYATPLIYLIGFHQTNPCGTIHIHEGLEELGNPLTHFITQGPLTMYAARYGNLGTDDGPWCLVKTEDSNWAGIKALYR